MCPNDKKIYYPGTPNNSCVTAAATTLALSVPSNRLNNHCLFLCKTVGTIQGSLSLKWGEGGEAEFAVCRLLLLIFLPKKTLECHKY